MTSAVSCAFCNGAADAGSNNLGEMLGPIGHTPSGDSIYVHRQCALWSPEVTCFARHVLAACVVPHKAVELHVL